VLVGPGDDRRGDHRHGGIAIKRLVVILAVVVGFAVSAVTAAGQVLPGSATMNHAGTAAACPNETVAVFGKPTTLRFVLRDVSCRKAHALIRTYFGDATRQSCRARGVICWFDLPGGWVCSFPAFLGEGGGFFAACTTKNALSAKVRVFKVNDPTSTSGAALWAALGGKVICGLAVHAPNAPGEVLCAARPVPAPRHTSPEKGDPGFVFLGATGQPALARLSQYSWTRPDGWEAKGRATLKNGQTWRHGAVGVTCAVSSIAVRCANPSHHGFTITRSSYHAF
jgi:hypothetical protein